MAAIPYVAANMLVQRLMEESPEVKGFIGHRGAPTVLEVSQETFSSPIIYFYYPENREYYTLENDKDFWVIQGPSTLSDIRLKKVLPISQARFDETSPIESAQTTQSTKNSLQHPTNGKLPSPKSSTQKRDYVPLEKPRKEISSSKIAATATKEGEAATKPAERAPRVSPAKNAEIVQHVLSSGPHPKGEISPKGDLVHYVTQEDETLQVIARWYTYDTQNAEKIAKVSGISSKQKLSLGDVVIVPSYMLKNKSRLSPLGVESLQQQAK